MTGTEKQIAWAETIKASTLALLTGEGLMQDVTALRGKNCDDLIAHFVRGAHVENKAKVAELAQAANAKLAEIDDASFWINNRSQTPTDPETAIRWWRIANSL